MQEIIETPAEDVTPQRGAGDGIQALVVAAKNYPRKLGNVLNRVADLATTDQETAIECFFSKPTGGKPVVGPSIRLAEILQSSWGNMRITSKVVDVVTDTDKPYCIVEATGMDLETVNMVSSEVRHPIQKIKSGKRRGDLLTDLACMAGQAIARRNVIFQLVPRAFLKRIMDDIRKCAMGDAKSVKQNLSAAMDWLKKAGATEKEILAYVNKDSFEEMGEDDLIMLRSVAEQVRAGEETIESALAFRDKAEEVEKSLKASGKAADPKAEKGDLFPKPGTKTS